jgi:succinate dehydrogenase/fumarate reductase flavoprotein subunit
MSDDPDAPQPPRPHGRPPSLKRDGSRLLAYGAAATALPVALTLAARHDPANGVRREECDLLVIGGGAAGIFAALAAREAGLEVVLLDKGRVGASGLSPWAGGINYFDREKGDRAAWHRNVARLGDYVNRPDWLDLYIDQSQAFHDRLKQWGILDSNIVVRGKSFRARLVESGVTLIERIMVTGLLRAGDGRIAGATGFHFDDGDAPLSSVAVKAKAVILCTGPATFKSPGFPAWGQTGDGDALAYAAGAMISGKEFSDTHMSFARYPAASWEGWGPSMDRFMTGAHDPQDDNPFMLNLDRYFQVMRGVTDTIGTGGPPGTYGSPGGPVDPRDHRPPMPPPPPGAEGPPPPIEIDFARFGTQMVGGATNGMAPHKAEGVFCPDTSGAAQGAPGLFAAGDALSSMLVGATYSMGGTSYLGSCIMGDHVARQAIAYLKAAPRPQVSEQEVRLGLAAITRYRQPGRGHSPQWISQVLREAMMPFYVLYVKSPERMAAALTTVQYLRQSCLPQLRARTGHELRQAHETAHMLLNAELKLTAGLFRKESRGNHYREDAPARNDAEWLCWVTLRDEDGRVVAAKHPVPRKWHPDAALPYRARYPKAFPGETAEGPAQPVAAV